MAPILGLGVGRGMAEAVEPLSHSERLEVQGLIAARARIAWAFSAVAVAATAMLLLRFAVRGLGGDVGLMAMTVALARGSSAQT